MRKRGATLGFIRLEELGEGKCRYVGCWRYGVPVVVGEVFEERIAPAAKLALLRSVCQELDSTPKP